MARLVLLGPAREAAGTGLEETTEATVGEVLDAACERHGEAFAKVLAASNVWLNGDEADPAQSVGADDEVAVVPPVSGG